MVECRVDARAQKSNKLGKQGGRNLRVSLSFYLCLLLRVDWTHAEKQGHRMASSCHWQQGLIHKKDR